MWMNSGLQSLIFLVSDERNQFPVTMKYTFLDYVKYYYEVKYFINTQIKILINF